MVDDIYLGRLEAETGQVLAAGLPSVLNFAHRLDEIDPERISLWGDSCVHGIHGR